MYIKTIISVLAATIGTLSFLPYLRDIFLLKTKPHSYTWLIWSITQGTALFAVLYGGGGWGVLNLAMGVILATVVFLFSLQYGTKSITIFDTIILIIAFLAIVIWWQLDQPLISVILVSIIDVIGYIPSYRKSYKDPWSETLISWVGFSLSNIFSIIALSEYNALTLTYIISITSANLVLLLICFLRLRFVPVEIK